MLMIIMTTAHCSDEGESDEDDDQYYNDNG